MFRIKPTVKPAAYCAPTWESLKEARAAFAEAGAVVPWAPLMSQFLAADRAHCDDANADQLAIREDSCGVPDRVQSLRAHPCFSDET